MQNHYVYVHKKKTNGEVFYVGKGTGRRAYVTSHRSKFWKYIATKHGVEIMFVIIGITEELAFDIEKTLINYYGRRDFGSGQLVNMTDGGEGSAGYKHSNSAKQAIRQTSLNRKLSEDARKKLSNSAKGRKFSEKANEARRIKTIRPVIRSDGVQYESIVAAVIALEQELKQRVVHSNISNSLRGVDKTAYGYKWKYLTKGK